MRVLMTNGGLGLAFALFLFGCQKEGVEIISDAGVSQGGAGSPPVGTGAGGTGGLLGTGGASATGGGFATGGGPAAGGAPATGGRTGQGGSQGGVSGGAPGTGGQSSSGGAIGTGGGAKTGGAIGAGGMLATGGSTGPGGANGGAGGAGGSAAGGSLGGSGGGLGAGGSAGGSHGGAGGGSGGAGGQVADGGVSCTDLENQYQAALPAARSCDVNAIGQCQQPVSSSLSPCFVNCMTYVNNALTLNAIKASWVQAGCNQIVAICPLIACIQPKAGVCVAADAGGGTCSSVSGILASAN